MKVKRDDRTKKTSLRALPTNSRSRAGGDMYAQDPFSEHGYSVPNGSRVKVLYQEGEFSWVETASKVKLKHQGDEKKKVEGFIKTKFLHDV